LLFLYVQSHIESANARALSLAQRDHEAPAGRSAYR
jgi:hypothetical protein